MEENERRLSHDISRAVCYTKSNVREKETSRYFVFFFFFINLHFNIFALNFVNLMAKRKQKTVDKWTNECFSQCDGQQRFRCLFTFNVSSEHISKNLQKYSNVRMKLVIVLESNVQFKNKWTQSKKMMGKSNCPLVTL